MKEIVVQIGRAYGGYGAEVNVVIDEVRYIIPVDELEEYITSLISKKQYIINKTPRQKYGRITLK